MTAIFPIRPQQLPRLLLPIIDIFESKIFKCHLQTMAKRASALYKLALWLYYVSGLQINIVLIHKTIIHTHIHTMQGNTYPTDWYNYPRVIPPICVCVTSSDWLKVDFWIQGPVAADTSHSGTIFDQSESRKQDVSQRLIGQKTVPLCDVSAARTLYQTNFQPIRTCLTHAQIHGMTVWTCIIPLDMYRLA